MSKNEVNLQAIKGSENRYSQVTTSLLKPLQVNAQSTTLLIQNLSQSKKLLGTKQSELGTLFVANTDQDKLVRITDQSLDDQHRLSSNRTSAPFNSLHNKQNTS